MECQVGVPGQNTQSRSCLQLFFYCRAQAVKGAKGGGRPSTSGGSACSSSWGLTARPPASPQLCGSVAHAAVGISENAPEGDNVDKAAPGWGWGWEGGLKGRLPSGLWNAMHVFIC